ncbi:MAG: matrixin family metalloprotease [Methanospirillum sp.]
MVPMDDAALAAGADEIVRGTITNVQSQWNADKTEILTTATVTVKGRAKGTGPETFTLTVPGGTADGINQWVEDEPTLEEGTSAIIFVTHSATRGTTIFGGNQGYVPIEEDTVVRSADGSSAVVTADTYERYLAALVAGESPALPQSNVTVRAAAGTGPIITSVSPESASAGTGTVITITGSGFGTKASRQSQADVIFSYKNIDTAGGGISAIPIYASGNPYFTENEDDIVYPWTDTQIKVKVPVGKTEDGYGGGSASSGIVFIRTDAGAVSWGHPFTVTFSYGRKLPWKKPIQFYFNPTPFAPAIIGITNAANTWNAANPTSSVRFVYAGLEQTAGVAYDGKNTICFRPASEFTSSTMRAETTITSTVPGGQIIEADIKFNEGYSWQVGNTASGTTFNVETIALHELGHVLGLNDLYGYYPTGPNDLGKAMFGMTEDSFGNMNEKTLDADDIAGVRWLYPSTVVAAPGATGPPTDTNGDGIYDDVNGNTRRDFADIVLYFNQMNWIAANEPIAVFDCNHNVRIDFADVTWLFTHL